VIEVTTNRIEEKTEMGLNDIGKITLKTAQPVFADAYQANPANGTFILVDEFSNATVAVGFVD
jgi:sulfate adenylyltransferase subunit 1